MKLARLLAARALLCLARAADAGLAIKAGRLCASFAEWLAPWTKPGASPPTLREIALGRLAS